MKFILLLSLVFSPFMSLASKNGGGEAVKKGQKVLLELSEVKHLRKNTFAFPCGVLIRNLSNTIVTR